MTSRLTAVNERLLFLKRFLASPAYLGSITPSSTYLVRALLSVSNVSQARQIVELGPGTGPFTAGLLASMPADGRLLCVERDSSLAEHLRRRFIDPRLIVATADAQNLPEQLGRYEFDDQVPLIVSGLPFTSLPHVVRDGILQAIVTTLSSEGEFVLYQYSYAMRGHLRRHFRTVQARWVLRNIPPAVCMRCRL